MSARGLVFTRYQISTFSNFQIFSGLRGARNNGKSGVHGHPAGYERSSPFKNMGLRNVDRGKTTEIKNPQSAIKEIINQQ